MEIKYRDDFKNDAEKAAFIEKHGLEKFQALPSLTPLDRLRSAWAETREEDRNHFVREQRDELKRRLTP